MKGQSYNLLWSYTHDSMTGGKDAIMTHTCIHLKNGFMAMKLQILALKLLAHADFPQRSLTENALGLLTGSAYDCLSSYCHSNLWALLYVRMHLLRCNCICQPGVNLLLRIFACQCCCHILLSTSQPLLIADGCSQLVDCLCHVKVRG